MDQYEKAANQILQYMEENNLDYTEKQQKADAARDKFLAKYSPDQLKAVPDDQLLDEAKQLARDLTHNGPVAVKYARRCMNIYYESGDEDHRVFSELVKELYFDDHMDERLEAINSFNEKRQPDFSKKKE